MILQSEPLCLFPIYRARAMYEHWTFFQCTHRNGQLVDHEETFAEFDKKCIGLELQTTPLSLTAVVSLEQILT